MSVTVKSCERNFHICAFCPVYAKYEVGLDTSLYGLVYKVCDDTKCIDQATDLMKQKSDDLGYSKTKSKREREDASDISWLLEGWGSIRLQKLSKAKLVELAVERGVPKSGSKGEIADNLIRWKTDGGMWAPKKNKYDYL